MKSVIAQSQYEPECGELRIVTGTITEYAPHRTDADEDGNVKYAGLMVEEFDVFLDADCFEVEHWRGVCPLVDAPIHGLVDRLPAIKVSQ